MWVVLFGVGLGVVLGLVLWKAVLANVSSGCCSRQPLRLYKAEDVPEYARSPYIDKHYRLDYSVREAVCSIGHIHNARSFFFLPRSVCSRSVQETANIWTHLFGIVFFFGFLLAEVLETPKVPREELVAQFFVALVNACNFVSYSHVRQYLVGSVTLFVFSTMFHTFNCLSMEVRRCSL